MRKIEVREEVGGEEYSHYKTQTSIVYGWLTTLLVVMMLSNLLGDFSSSKFMEPEAIKQMISTTT